MSERRRRLGVLTMAAASCCAAIGAASVRYVTDDLGVAATVFYRGAFAIAVLLPMLAATGRLREATVAVRPGLVFWRCFFGLLGMVAYFYCVAHFGLGIGIVSAFSSPLWIPILSAIFLKEKASPMLIGLAVVGFVGVLLIVGPSALVLDVGAIIFVLTGMLAAMAMICVRKLRNTDPPVRLTFWFTVICCLGSLPFALVQDMTLTLQTSAGVGVLAAATTANQWLLSRAYAYAPAPAVAPASYLAVAVGCVLGVLLWDEHFSIQVLSGIGLIIAAGVGVSVLGSTSTAKALVTPKDPAS